MDANNFIVENVVKFYTNRTDYPHQPIFNMVNSQSLTGNNYVSLFRYVENDDYSGSIPEDEDAKLVLLISNDQGTYSSTGWKDITCMPIERGSTDLDQITVTEFEDPRSTTAEPTEYKIVTAVLDGRADVVTSFNGVHFRDITIPDLTPIDDLNFMGTAFRPQSTGVNPDGVSGNSLVLQYIYNREQIGYSSLSAVTVADKSGNDINGNIFGQGLGQDPLEVGLFESGTVTGWTHGPIEGAFQMEGGFTSGVAAVDPTHIISDTSTLFHNYTDWTTSGVTMMAHVKFNSTGDCNVMSLGSTSGSLPSIFGVSLRNGSLVVDALDGDSNLNSITAGKFEDGSAEYPNATFRHTEIGKWIHICARIDMNNINSSTSGTTLFVNGERVPIYNTQTTLDENMANLIKVNNGSSLHLGIDTSDHTLSALTGSVGITRVFNSALSDQEIFQNYICTIPTSMLIDSIKIG